jgi:hypothetical protein
MCTVSAFTAACFVFSLASSVPTAFYSLITACYTMQSFYIRAPTHLKEPATPPLKQAVATKRVISPWDFKNNRNMPRHGIELIYSHFDLSQFTVAVTV